MVTQTNACVEVDVVRHWDPGGGVDLYVEPVAPSNNTLCILLAADNSLCWSRYLLT